MSLYYRDALRRGQKEFRACTAQGKYPYLPVLDDFLPCEATLRTVNLGVVQIPLEMVCGTRTAGRTQAFARNFMPLMEEDSEFALKWDTLCQSQVEEGIREPIYAYEFMLRYYVQEGNKRVSVLKYMGADAINAHVIRILPQRNGSREVEVYYEFLDFYQLSQINFLEITKLGGYARVQNLVGKQEREPWSEEERKQFASAYYYFQQAYQANGGARLRLSVGDALLAYLEIYGYSSLLGKGAEEIKKMVARVWEEITLQQEAAPIAVQLAPGEGGEEKGSGGLLSWVFPKALPKVIKVAFLHDRNPGSSGWTYSHELGRAYLENAFSGQVETCAYFDVLDSDPLPILEEAIAQGNQVIFTTSPRLLPSSLRVAVDHPNVMILNCSLNTSHRYVRTYYARMYEAKFICGAVAGALAGDRPVGYICDYPIFGQVAGINAFAMGVQLTNPRIRVRLEWSTVGGIEAATRRLTDRGITLISTQDISRMDAHQDLCFGLSILRDGVHVNLATPVWQRGVYYEVLLRRMQSKAYRLEYQESPRALNYYWGMSEGVVELRCSDKLPDSTKKLARFLRNEICTGSCSPFRGPLYDQNSRKLIGENEVLDTQQIMEMDWLADNVIGSIPAYDELDERARATVGIAGVEPSTQEKMIKWNSSERGE